MSIKWIPISGYDNYEVSECGEIRNGQRLLSIQKKKNGYVHICLCKKGKLKHFRVHRLVAEAFIPNGNNLPVVNHIDGKKDNNSVSNLEWVTNSDNDKHAFATGLRTAPKAWKGKTGSNHNRYQSVIQLDINENIIQTFGSATEAERVTKISHQNIIKVCRGQRPTAGKFKWKYGN